VESWVALRFTSTSAPQPSTYAKCLDKESEKLHLIAMVTTRGDSTNSESKVENIRHWTAKEKAVGNRTRSSVKADTRQTSWR
jgi:hypothetical protein